MSMSGNEANVRVMDQTKTVNVSLFCYGFFSLDREH